MSAHIVKITIAQLEPGMYVHDLSSEWTDVPFGKRFLVTDQGMVERIRDFGIRELYVDTLKGNYPQGVSHPLPQVEQRLDHELQQVVSEPEPEPQVSYMEEISIARRVHEEAAVKVTSILHDARMGKRIEAEHLEPVVANMAQSIFRNPSAMMSLGRIRHVDQYTFEHSVSVGTFLIAFAKHLNFDENIIHHIGMGALLHDIGKTRVPDTILNKPGKLSDEEFVVMKRHAQYSGEILSQSKSLSSIAVEVAVQHHERFDGTGYPKGLKGAQISPYGQMAAVVDVYDAITSDRCYHKGEAPTAVLRKLLEWSKFHFNPTVVQQFIKCVGIYPPGTLVKLKNKQLAIVLDSGPSKTLQPTIRVIFDTAQLKYVRPFTVDLQSDEGKFYGVTGFEDPAAWKIRVEDFIPRQ
ncbi:HD-GYP domain-containing protein [Desulfurispirillum indicum]|uniref:HD-GYP domain-containing protein n=1 Tax=Desulfurispirillum indicum TaxID=936456 RepID=UPI001CFA1ABB|nr:HD-GYP domain-containing protein [Desulfurispirillum indicum]UCZ55792.1 HD-GYP domain-containing protein [Desulfurispirillum indicum]